MNIITSHPVAVDSLDHLTPKGAKNDNNTSAGLLDELARHVDRPYRLLDIGCAGGQFVVDCNARGNHAVGLEGSSYMGDNGLFNWPQFGSKCLFTCDVRYPFEIVEGGYPVAFKVITAWEVMEHFDPAEIDNVLENVASHLAPDGMFLCSISPSTADEYHLSAHLSERQWDTYFERRFKIWGYPFKHSPREDARHTSRFVKLTRREP